MYRARYGFCITLYRIYPNVFIMSHQQSLDTAFLAPIKRVQLPAPSFFPLSIQTQASLAKPPARYRLCRALIIPGFLPLVKESLYGSRRKINVCHGEILPGAFCIPGQCSPNKHGHANFNATDRIQKPWQETDSNCKKQNGSPISQFVGEQIILGYLQIAGMCARGRV